MDTDAIPPSRPAPPVIRRLRRTGRHRLCRGAVAGRYGRANAPAAPGWRPFIGITFSPPSSFLLIFPARQGIYGGACRHVRNRNFDAAMRFVTRNYRGPLETATIIVRQLVADGVDHAGHASAPVDDEGPPAVLVAAKESQEVRGSRRQAPTRCRNLRAALQLCQNAKARKKRTRLGSKPRATTFASEARTESLAYERVFSAPPIRARGRRIRRAWRYRLAPQTATAMETSSTSGTFG